MATNSSAQKFSAEVKGDYIYLKTWGELDANDLDAPVLHALELAKKHNIDKILDDIRKIDTSTVGLKVQTKAAGVMWKLKSFKKAAIILKNEEEISYLFFSMLQTLHLTGSLRGFTNEAEAIAWLEED